MLRSEEHPVTSNERILQRAIRAVTTVDPVERVQRFYQIQSPKIEFANRTTRYMNVGYWGDGATTLDAASEALATRMADAARFKPDDQVLDVGNGYGDQDIMWLQQRRVANIIGLNITPHHIRWAKFRAAQEGLSDRLDVRTGDATELPFDDNSFDRVVALESAFHFYPRRAFFAEAMRVLRPGGVLATTDIIPLDADTPQDGFQAGPLSFIRFSVDEENWHDAATYASQLGEAGFRDVTVESIRDRVWEPWRRYMVARIASPELVDTIGAEAHEGMAGLWNCQDVMPGELELLDYVIAVAHKP
jgi:erythromycin 3''-O-methyltransferase